MHSQAGSPDQQQAGGLILLGQDKTSNRLAQWCGPDVDLLPFQPKGSQTNKQGHQITPPFHPVLNLATICLLPLLYVMSPGPPLGSQPGLPLNFTSLFMQLQALVLKTTRATEHLWPQMAPLRG